MGEALKHLTPVQQTVEQPAGNKQSSATAPRAPTHNHSSRGTRIINPVGRPPHGPVKLISTPPPQLAFKTLLSENPATAVGAATNHIAVLH